MATTVLNKTRQATPKIGAPAGNVMVSMIRTLVLAMVFVLSPVLAQDYEAQLNHRKDAIVSALKEALSSEESASVEFECITHSRELAEGFARFHSPRESRIEVLGENRFRIIVTFNLDPSAVDFSQWLRTQFFTAIAYHCSMDVARPVAHHNKPLKYVPALPGLHRTRQRRAA